ncbi:hypothetical protein [Ensifer sesbaniae]|uniref:hypothetical protein n=1 Tax=Sinorhizobium/Ensifer group TaxID=227292 RepID=UPI000BBF4E0E|nr:hypothetical protein SF83666_d69950 [Sinorhizobium fredii CCBAU 83666]NRQ18927.1 hypothetical protein [Ensifer sesbaniae]
MLISEQMSASASYGVSNVEISGPSARTRHKEGRRAETAVSLGELIDRHIAAQLAAANAVHAWDERRATGGVTSVGYANELSDVARDEEATRLAIVNYLPRGERESRLKRTYLAAYLIATRGTLTANEINSVLDF